MQRAGRTREPADYARPGTGRSSSRIDYRVLGPVEALVDEKRVPLGGPASMTSFVGRERELADLERLLRRHRLITLTGIGGSGKTRLAVEAAARQAGAWPGGVWLVDLTAIADPELVAGTVAATLDVSERPGEPALDALVSRLRTEELLLVLDNCERLVAACALLAEAVGRSCPNVCILATSRVPLAADGELEDAVDPLPVPGAAAGADELEQSPAVRLFLDRGRAVRRDLGRSESALATVAGICRELDGLPLTIELAAARAKALSLDDIAARLADRFRFLRAWKRVADPRHRTLQATMDRSYDLLSEDERRVLPQLSVFAGGFTLEAVASVACGGDRERAAEVLARLVDASLVVVED